MDTRTEYKLILADQDGTVIDNVTIHITKDGWCMACDENEHDRLEDSVDASKEISLSKLIEQIL